MSAEWLIVHGHALLCAVDATSAPGTPAAMRAIGVALDFRFEPLPAGLRVQWRGARARFDFGRPPERIPGTARPAEVQLAAPGGPALRVQGTVRDLAQRWLPRRFDVELAAGAVVPLPLYPSPSGTQPGAGGSILGSLRLPDERPAAWARLALRVDVAPGRTVTSVAQADAAGDFVLAARRVPLPPADVANFPAGLRVFHRDGDWPDGIDPDTQQPWQMQAADTAAFVDEYAFVFPPGTRMRPSSFQRPALVIRAPQP